MKVVQLTSPEKVEVRDIPARREAEPGEALLEPILVGLTGTDAMRYRKGAPTKDGFRSPHVPGAEFVARVLRVGRGVDPTLVGKRIVANPLAPCLKCTWCFEGNHHLCPNMRVLGTPPVAGALQQVFAWPANLCIPVPDSIRDEEAVLLIPLSMAIHIADQANVPLMASVAVIGCGSLGLLLAEVLRKTGAGEILAVDLIAYRRDAGFRHGATRAYDPISAMDAVSRWPRRGVDIAIDVSNASEGSRSAVQIVRTGGRVLIAGIPEDNRILFNARDARHKELTIQFVRRPHDTLARAVQLLQSGSLRRIGELVTHRFLLDQIAEAYRLLRTMNEEVIKVVIEMQAKPASQEPAEIEAKV